MGEIGSGAEFNFNIGSGQAGSLMFRVGSREAAPADGDEDDRSLGISEPSRVDDERRQSDERRRHAQRRPDDLPR